jgi:NADH:ubiquinone oxidoreductase subunit 6 (subunit J)
MVEVYLFIVVGAVAIIAATMMLLSENAVHSALFLILNFACVAFMYLMLEAPFLAMVQVAVYAGAIMVLFLFVIMLLGADQAESPASSMTRAPGSRYHTWVALALALVLLLTVAVGIGRGDVGSIQNNDQPVLRVVHAAGTAEFVDVRINGEVLKSDVPYRETTGFSQLPAGVHTVEVVEAGTDTIIWSGEVEIDRPQAPGFVNTAVVYGIDTVDMQLYTEDFSAPPNRQVRLRVFNAFNQPMSLQDIGLFQREGDAIALLSGIEPGQVSDPVLIDEGTYSSIRLMRPAEETSDGSDARPFFAVRDRTFPRNTNTLFVVAEQANSLQPNVTIVTERTRMPFGSPQAIGESLFTRYVLPLQVVGLLLLAALVGVIVVAQRQVSPAAERSATARPVRRRVSRPLASVIANQVQSDDNPESPPLTSGD